MQYEITNLSSEELNTSFGSEFNFSLLAGNAHDRYYDIPGHTLDKRNLASIGEMNNVKQVSLVDEWLKLKLSLAVLAAGDSLARAGRDGLAVRSRVRAGVPEFDGDADLAHFARPHDVGSGDPREG